MARHKVPSITCAEELFAHDETLDAQVCGCGLADPGATRFRLKGANDPTPTPYFVLRELFGHFSFSEKSHLLDVGCGTGRVLAHFVREGCPGRATGIELDPRLAEEARSWASRHRNLSVLQGDVLGVDLSQYTDFYLFNPFGPHILIQFIAALEAQAIRPVTVVHMSDNGDTRWYEGRFGWEQVASGAFDVYVNDLGSPVVVYDNPQHYTVWRFDPSQR